MRTRLYQVAVSTRLPARSAASIVTSPERYVKSHEHVDAFLLCTPFVGDRMLATIDGNGDELACGIDRLAKLLQKQAKPMGSDVPEGGRIGLRIAERLASAVVDVLVVDEDRNASHDALYLPDDKSPPFPARPGRRGAMIAS